MKNTYITIPLDEYNEIQESLKIINQYDGYLFNGYRMLYFKGKEGLDFVEEKVSNELLKNASEYLTELNEIKSKWYYKLFCKKS